MKQIFFLLIIIAIGKVAWDRLQTGVDEARNPEVISNPVYAEVRIVFDVQNRSFEGVLLAETVDDADCKNYTNTSLEKTLGPKQSNGVVSWHMKSAECKTQLSARNAKLFENKPAHANYLRLARGVPEEREIRVIYWGLTANEGKMVCNLVPKIQPTWKGEVTCIQAAGA